MKKINGIESIALGLKDSGGEVFTNFPGYQSHKLFSLLGGKHTSVNEKIAYEIAWGSSFAGKRSAVMFKNVGLNDAADPFLNSMLVGANAGLVLVVFDDMFVEGSQSRQDSRHYFDFYKGLWFEPYSIQNAYDVAYKSFLLSERFKLPVIIRVTNQIVEQLDVCKRKKFLKKHSPLVYDHKQFVIHPINSKFQRQSLAKKNLQIQNFIDKLYKNNFAKNSDKDKLVVFGYSRNEELQYVKEDCQKIQIYTYPIPEPIKNLAKSKQKVSVLEQGDAFGYQKIQGSLGQNPKAKELVSNTGIIPDKSNRYIVSKNYEKVFSILKSFKQKLIIGDLGEYTKDNLDTIDACLSFGSSPAVAIGCNLAGVKKTISVIGDAAYLHSGKNSIIEAIERNIPLKVIIICNGGSQGTGGQHIPGELFYQPKGVLKLKLNYKMATKTEVRNVLNKLIKDDKVSVLYLKL